MKRTQRKVIALLMGLLLVECQGRGYRDRIYDEGVSIELAQWRKETIKELRYGLRFDIPEQRDEAIEAEACIRFVLEHRQEVVLEEVQRTGDIFFPKKWARVLLRHHHSEEAQREVEAFFAAHPDYSPLLKNKILQVVDF